MTKAAFVALQTNDQKAGISNNTIDNSSAYIQFWLERLTHMLRDDSKSFLKATLTNFITGLLFAVLSVPVLKKFLCNIYDLTIGQRP